MTRRTLLAALALCTLYFAAWPVPFEGAAWNPGVDRGLPDDSRLAQAAVVELGVGLEDVAVDAAGRIYGGDAQGRIWRAAPGGAPEVFVNTGGRPLGMEFDARGHLIVCDSTHGLLDIAPDGEWKVLSREHGGRPYGFTDDLDIGPDGTIYFSDASDVFGQDRVREAMAASEPNGRLLAHDPKTGRTRLLVDGLHFANGVAVAPGGDFVLVVETTRYRVMRHWLRGPKAGTTDLFADNLPGFPDGISRGSEGRYWVAIYGPRVDVFDAMLPHPSLRRVLQRVPRALQPEAVPQSAVLALDAGGEVTDILTAPAGTAMAPLTSVQEHDDALYLGSISHAGYGRLPLPATRVAKR